jgi:exopolysaccharide biosynthesis polyprenyl glycosylphosphotransferase
MSAMPAASIEDSRWSGSAAPAVWPVNSQQRSKLLLPALARVVLLMVDVLVVTAAFMLAYGARFASDDTLPSLSLDRYVRLGIMAGVLTSLLLASHGLYNLERPQSWPLRFRGIASSTSTALILAITLSFFLGDQAFSRLWLAVGWTVAIAGLAVWRVLAHHLYEYLRDTFGPTNRVLIVGANRLGRELAQELNREYEVLGFVDNGTDLDHPEVTLLGPISQLDELVQSYAIDELIIALPGGRREQVNHILARGFQRHVQVKLLPELDPMLPDRLALHELGGRHYIGFVPVAAVSWIKRAMDLVLVSLGLLAIAPALLIIALAVKLDSQGPVFYRQRRVGKDGQHFSMLKFRSMRQDADQLLAALQAHNEASGPLFKMRNDPRVTRVGAVLRRWSIDELPQLFNVLRGEMSLVGPRPPLPKEVEKYEDWQLGRLRAVPGLTGLWQVSGRSEVPFHDMVRLDLHYIRNWSLGLDFEILLRTVPAVLTNRGAY